MVGGIGCVTSSVITLLVFFPRSIQKEAGYQPRNKSSITTGERPLNPPASPRSPHFDSSGPLDKHQGVHVSLPRSHSQPQYSPQSPSQQLKLPEEPFNRGKIPGDGVWEMVDMPSAMEQGQAPHTYPKIKPHRPKRPSQLHPLVLNYTSPIGKLVLAPSCVRSSWLT